MIETFLAFNIIAIPRSKNSPVDSLAIVASRLSPLEEYEASRFAKELLYKPSVPDNIVNWRVFEGHKHIISFFTNEENFRDLTIDDEVFQEMIARHDNQIPNPTYSIDMNQIKLHTMPQRVVNIENLFDLQEKFKKSKNTKTSSSCPLYEVINLGTIENLRNINLRKSISLEERKAYLHFLKEYQDVFSWSYQDLKTYDTRIIQHTIPLIPEVKPFQQKMQKFHPSLEPLMLKEIKKLLDANIIFQFRNSTWVANLVPLKKQSVEICLCVDFINLNRSSKKYNYHVPPMEQLLQTILGMQIFSLLDGFLVYN